MMRILCYSSYFLPYTSGITTTTYHIFHDAGKDKQVFLLTFNYDKKLKKKEVMGNISIVRMPWFFKISKGFISPRSLFYFLNYVPSSDLVVVNLPNVEALPLIILSKMFRKKVIVLFHCNIELSGGPFSFFLTQVVRFSGFLQLLLADIIVTYPDYLTGHWYADFFKGKIRTALPLFDKAKSDENRKKKLLRMKGRKRWIGFIGRISSEKGVEYLIDACRILKNKKTSFELILAGPEAVGEEKYYKRILGLLKKNNIPHRLLGMQTRRQLISLYNVLDVVVVPSINQTEAISIVQLEAMSQGTPVIATALPGVRYPILKTGMGILVRPKDPKELKEALIKILEDKNSFSSKANLAKVKRLLSHSEAFYKQLFS